MELLIILIVWCGICGGLGYAVAKDDNKGLGAVLGIILGPIGVIVAAVMK